MRQYRMYKFPIDNLVITIVIFVLLVYVGFNPLIFFECNASEKFGVLLFCASFIIPAISTVMDVIRYRAVRTYIAEGKYVIGKVVDRKKKTRNKGRPYYQAICRYEDNDGKEYFFRSNYYGASTYPFEEGSDVHIFVDIDKYTFLYYVYPNERM